MTDISPQNIHGLAASFSVTPSVIRTVSGATPPRENESV